MAHSGPDGTPCIFEVMGHVGGGGMVSTDASLGELAILY